MTEPFAITRLTVWRQWQPFADGPYTCRGHSEDGTDSTILAIETADGSIGLGEMAPLGAFYSAAFAEAARAALARFGPSLIGLDATQPRRIRTLLDHALTGHPYAKSAIDMACCDLAARRAGQPLCEALGGRFGDDVELYRSVSQAEPAAMAASALAYIAGGYRRLQVKVGPDPRLDAERIEAVRDAVGPEIALIADANGGWTSGDARHFLAATAALDYDLEQPCATLDECLALRASCDRRLLADESIETLRDLVRARQGGIDGVTIKLSRVGGVTAAALLRDVACELGLPTTIEDTGGAQIDAAATVHLSLSTPTELRRHTVDLHGWVTVANATGMPDASGGRLRAPDGPGLGVQLDRAALGEPVLVIG